MSGFGVDGGSVGNFEKTHIQIKHEETNKDKGKDEGMKTVQLVNGNTAKYTNENGENQEEEESISMAGENVENPINKFKTKMETEPEKEKQEKSNSFLRPSVILNLCLVLVNFALVAVVMSRTSEIPLCCSNGNVPAFVNQTEENGAGAGQILDEMKLELSGIKEWKNSTEETFESHRLLIQSLQNQTKLEEQLESLEKENGELRKSHEELKEQFESLSQNFELLESNISSIRLSLLVTPAPAQNKTETTPAPPSTSITSCSDAMEILSSPRSKKQTIYPHGNGNRTSLEVVCDFETDGGGWTVIQKRTSGPKTEFSRNWTEYASGFGSLDKNFWLGLENIHALTKNGDQELRIELEDFEGKKYYAKYSSFSISDGSDFYRLTVGGYSGTANDSLTNPVHGTQHVHNGMRFSTIDRDNDNRSGESCVVERGDGGWWFNNCGLSGLNGLYYEKGERISDYKGILWHQWKEGYYSLAKSEMKIRKRR